MHEREKEFVRKVVEFTQKLVNEEYRMEVYNVGIELRVQSNGLVATKSSIELLD